MADDDVVVVLSYVQTVTMYHCEAAALCLGFCFVVVVLFCFVFGVFLSFFLLEVVFHWFWSI